MLCKRQAAEQQASNMAEEGAENDICIHSGEVTWAHRVDNRGVSLLFDAFTLRKHTSSLCGMLTPGPSFTLAKTPAFLCQMVAWLVLENASR